MTALTTSGWVVTAFSGARPGQHVGLEKNLLSCFDEGRHASERGQQLAHAGEDFCRGVVGVCLQRHPVVAWRYLWHLINPQ